MAMAARVAARRTRTNLIRRAVAADDWVDQLVHDLRNPLGIVESFAEIIPSASADERDELCERLRLNAHRALQVLEEFALLVDLRRGSGVPQLAEWDGVELARELVLDLEAVERRPGRICLRGVPRLAVRASRPHIACALRVLLRETLRAVPPDRVVGLVLDAADQTVVFRISVTALHDERARARLAGSALELAHHVAVQHGGRLTMTRGRRAVIIALTLPANR